MAVRIGDHPAAYRASEGRRSGLAAFPRLTACRAGLALLRRVDAVEPDARLAEPSLTHRRSALR